MKREPASFPKPFSPPPFPDVYDPSLPIRTPIGMGKRITLERSYVRQKQNPLGTLFRLS